MTVVDLTTAQKTELLRETSPHALVSFIEIDHPTLQAPIRVVNDYTDFVYGGNTYTATRGAIRLLTDGGQAPTATLSVPNVDRQIGIALRATTDRATVTLTILSTEDFDITVDPCTEIGTATPVYIMSEFEVVSASVTPFSVDATIQLRDYSQEPWPSQRATQNRLPALFR